MIVAIVTNLGTILVLIWFMLRVDKSEDDSWHSWRFWNPPSSDDNEDELDADSPVADKNLVADDDMSVRSPDRYASSNQEELGESSSRGSNKSEESSRDE